MGEKPHYATVLLILPGKSLEESKNFAAANGGLSIKNKIDKIIYFQSNRYEITISYSIMDIYFC
jgi:hypothetical protein